MGLLLVILSGFAVSGAVITLSPQFKNRIASWLFIWPLLLLVFFCSYLPGIWEGKTFLFRNPWVSSLGVHLDLRIDALSLLFSLMITGIGTLVYWFSGRYLKGKHYHGRFFSYLTFFMASMLGLVLSDNLLALFIFWELTSISSFFLIGFQNEDEQARKNALTALAVTAGGGFLLMAGFIIMGSYMESYSISELLRQPGLFRHSSVYPVVLFLILAGAFTKSAQFPFHFWLPGAMKAPTPVSAYLHSATMVKAGIYLLVRLLPILSGTEYWHTTIIIAGCVTMTYGAVQSLFRRDLKSILAYTTISSLGLMVLLIGIGSERSLLALFVFIIAHALYKATLFLVAGVIDYKTKSRDITTLRGLRKIMPQVALAGGLAAFSYSGLPLSIGFIAKELVYDASVHLHGINTWIITFCILVSNAILMYTAFCTGVLPFFGRIPDKFAALKRPHRALWLPPVILSILGIVFGVFPHLLDGMVNRLMGTTRVLYANVHLSVWHGFNTAFVLSLITIALGSMLILVYRASDASERFIQRLEPLSPKQIIIRFSEGIAGVSRIYTSVMHNGYLRIYLLVIVVFFTALVGYKLFAEVPITVNLSRLSGFRVYELIVIIVMLAAILMIVSTSSRLTAMIALGVIGYCICLIFIFYGAPDLAMTQFTIDTLTVVLFMLVMYQLPNFLQFKNTKIQIRDAVVAIAFGTLIAIIALQAMVTPYEKEVSEFYAKHAYTMGKGKNVVNVILVDFRGLDTMIETVVLSIAAIGVYSMLKLKINKGIKE